MRRYVVCFKYSRDNIHWTQSTKTVNAETQHDAMDMIKSLYPYVQIVYVR